MLNAKAATAQPAANSAPPTIAMVRGFLFGSRAPPHAAVIPRKNMAKENIQATWVLVHSKTSLNSLTRRPWKKLHAYTVPRQSMRTVPIAAITQRCADKVSFISFPQERRDAQPDAKTYDRCSADRKDSCGQTARDAPAAKVQQ